MYGSCCINENLQEGRKSAIKNFSTRHLNYYSYFCRKFSTDTIIRQFIVNPEIVNNLK
jgi:hypothetical protein